MKCLFIATVLLATLALGTFAFDVDYNQVTDVIQNDQHAAYQYAYSHIYQQLQKVQHQHDYHQINGQLLKAMQLQVSSNCSTYLGNYISSFITCYSSLQSVFSGDASSTQSDTVLGNYCGSTGCRATLLASAGNLVSACNATEFQEFSQSGFHYADVTRLLNYPCVKYENKFCWTDFWKAVRSFQTSTGTGTVVYTNEKLDLLCTPCTQLVLSSIYEDKNNTQLASAFNLLCLKSQDQYCMIFITNYKKNAPTSGNANDQANYLYSTFCSNSCFQLMLRSQLVKDSIKNGTNVDPSLYARMFDLLCSINKDGTPCINKAAQLDDAPFTCPSSYSNPVPACDANCVSTATSLFNNLGCCAGSILAAVNIANAISGKSSSNASAVDHFFNDICHVPIPTKCDARGVVRTILLIKNLRLAYYLAHKSDVEAKLKSDLALASGAANDAISITSANTSTIAGGGVVFTVEISSSTYAQAATYQQQLQLQIQNGNLALPSTQSLPPDAVYDPSQSTGVDATGSSVVAESGADRVMASFVLIAALLFSVKFF